MNIMLKMTIELCTIARVFDEFTWGREFKIIAFLGGEELGPHKGYGSDLNPLASISCDMSR